MGGTDIPPEEDNAPSKKNNSSSEKLDADRIILKTFFGEMLSLHPNRDSDLQRDIEALFPSCLCHSFGTDNSIDTESGWGEVTSTSICTDYQSHSEDGGGSRFPHTVNGMALAVPRGLAAILENGWDDRFGGVVVSEVFRGFMGGLMLLREGIEIWITGSVRYILMVCLYE